MAEAKFKEVRVPVGCLDKVTNAIATKDVHVNARPKMYLYRFFMKKLDICFGRKIGDVHIKITKNVILKWEKNYKLCELRVKIQVKAGQQQPI